MAIGEDVLGPPGRAAHSVLLWRRCAIACDKGWCDKGWVRVRVLAVDLMLG